MQTAKFPVWRLSLLSAIILLLITASCVEDNFDFDKFSGKVNLKPSFIVPVATGTLTIENLIDPNDQKDLNIVFDPDNSVRLVIREDSVFSVVVADILEIPLPESSSRQFDLNGVELGDITASAAITLGELTEAGRMNDPEATAIRNADGMNIIFPPIPDQQLGRFSVDQIADIDYVRFTEGNLSATLTNNLPVEISVGMRIINNVDDSEVAAFIFENLAPAASLTRVASLAGVTLYNDVSLEVSSFTSPGSGASLETVNLIDEISIAVTAENLKVDKGIARLSPTVVDSDFDTLDITFDPGIRIDYFSLSEGMVNYNISNAGAPFTLDLEVVNVSSSGGPFTFRIETDGLGGLIEGQEDLAGIEVDLTDEGHKIIFGYTLMVGSDVGMTEFDLSAGTLGFNMYFTHFKLGYAAGYFGQEVIDLDDDNFDLDNEFLDRITGDLSLTNPAVRLFYDNSIGLPLNMKFNIVGESDDGTESVTLLDPGHPGFDLAVPEQLFGKAFGEVVINRQTSNIVDLIALRPARGTFSASATQNPDGDTGTPNFITSESSLYMGVEIDLPLEMILSNIGFTDTLKVDIDPEDTDIIEMLVMMVSVNNRFPVAVNLALTLYDSVTNANLHTFSNLAILDAADVDSEGRVVAGSGKASEVEIEITESVLDHLRQADHIIVSATVNTSRNNNVRIPVKFEKTNGLDFKVRLSAKFNIIN